MAQKDGDEVKIMHVVGARPQFIKYFPVSRALEGTREQGKQIEDILVHTGQHYDYNMSKIFFDELGIREPGYHLGAGSGQHGYQTGIILQSIEQILIKERPNLVFVYGDTNSTLGGALAAAKLHIPVAHVEAGLRSFNKKMPEEINRVLTDHLSTMLLCPTETAVRNLLREGFTCIANEGRLTESTSYLRMPDSRVSSPLVVNVGDVMYDALSHFLQIARSRSRILENLGLAPHSYIILTIHRAENTDDPEQLCRIIDFVNKVSSGHTVIFPMHPRTRKLYGIISPKFSSNVRIIDPLGYLNLLILVEHGIMVMTDSGGLQKEAYWLETPCITLRDETEWVETVQSGWNVLYKDYRGRHHPSQTGRYLYGKGKSADAVVRICLEYLS